MGMTFNNRDTREFNKGTDFARGVMGNKKYVEFEFNTLATTPNYGTGIDISGINSKFGLASVSHCEIETKGGFVFNYDAATDKIHMWQSDNGGASVMVEETAGAVPAAVANVRGMAWGHD